MPTMKRLALLLLLPLPAAAEIYSWKEGEVTRISTEPPVWYRFEARVKGPRVLVTKGKRVMDDTALPLEERWRLRPTEHAPIPAGRRMF
jgi:hypothetical protein